MFLKFTKLLSEEFSGYSRQKFFKDLMAGLTVAAVALPLALAFGVSSGATAGAGLITAIIAGLVIGTLSGGFYQISGPTGAMSAILISLIAKYHMDGVFLATLMAGIFLLIAGIFKLGTLTNMIPSSVITGFTSGIAIIIALGQVNNLFGVYSEGDSALAKLWSYTKLGFHPDYPTLIIGICVILFIVFFPKKWNAIIPSSLLAIILATAAVMFFHIHVPEVGKIPTTLIPSEHLRVQNIKPGLMKELIAPALSIAVLGMIESLLCGASASRMTGKNLDSNQELVAQGVGNMLLPFFGGIPATAAIARTSVAIKSGAQTRIAGIIHAVTLMLSMFILTPVMMHIPLSALAGVLIVTSWRMNEWESIHYLFSHRLTSGIVKFLVTMVATVALDLSMAILLGVIVGLVFFIGKSATIEVNTESVDPTRMGKEAHPSAKNWTVVYLTGPLFFVNSEKVHSALSNLPKEESIIFSLRGVPNIDVTAAKMLLEFYEEHTTANRQVIFASMNAGVRKSLEKAGLKETEQQPLFFDSVNLFLEKLFQ